MSEEAGIKIGRYVLTKNFVTYDLSAVNFEFYPRYETGYQPRVAIRGDISDTESVNEFDLLLDEILISDNTIEGLICSLDDLEFTDDLYFYLFDGSEVQADEIYDDGILLSNEDFVSYNSIEKIGIKDDAKKLYVIATKDDLGLWLIPMPDTNTEDNKGVIC